MSATTVAAVGKAIGYASDLKAAIDAAKDRGINSLSEYSKRTLLSSRVYIEDVISGEAVVPGLMKLLNTMYAALCMISLRMNDLVAGSRTVRQMVAAVSTEEYHSIIDVVKSQFGSMNVTEREISLEDNQGKKDDGDKSPRINDVRIETDASRLFTGRLMEVTLGSKENSASIYFLVQLVPYIIPSIVMDEFLCNNIQPSSTLRWAQVKAGEIRFWKDFVFECDRVEKRRKALRVDKDGILREVEDHRQHNLWGAIKNFFRSGNDVPRRNVANSIIIISKSRLDKACRDLGLNIKNFRDREKIMGGTMALMLVAYDPNYGTVDLYLKGIQNRAEYTDQMVQAFTKKDDGGGPDLKQILPMLMAGNAQMRF